MPDDPVAAADEFRLEQMCARIGKFEIRRDVAAAAFDAGSYLHISQLPLTPAAR